MEILEHDFTRSWVLKEIKKIGDSDLRQLLSRLYTQEETRIREKGIETMMMQHLIRKWIPEYKYKGYDKEFVVHDFKSALLFTFKMYKSVKDAVEKDKRYYDVISKSIHHSFDRARKKFARRKNILIEYNKLAGYSENDLKDKIVNQKIDFINFDLDAMRYMMKLHNKVYNTE